MIHVIATIETVPGRRDALLNEFRRVRPLVLAEKGCIEYGAAVDEPTGITVQVAPRDTTVLIIEKWEDVPSLKNHLQAPHMAEYRGRIKDCVVGVKLQILRPTNE
jgi:quinol monooxygenase YgiN